MTNRVLISTNISIISDADAIVSVTDMVGLEWKFNFNTKSKILGIFGDRLSHLYWVIYIMNISAIREQKINEILK